MLKISFLEIMKKIALIGCTGSIGRQVCEIVRSHPDQFAFSALACKSNAKMLQALQNEFHPETSYCSETVKEDVFDGCDTAFIAVGGFEGLYYTLLAARAGKKIALANKESIVCGGELVLREAEKHGAELIPVDSEHSAIFQALAFRRDAKFEKLVLTASGGPFLHRSKEELERVTPQEALMHPTYRMGAKISVDSATLLNKGYEVIEAKWLYGADFSQIETVVHPESIVHSLVYFQDGAAMAQLSYPDMRLPIQLALTYPERLSCVPALDLAKIGALHFERLEEEKFPCYTLAISAGKAGGTCPTVLNAAAEIAVGAFLKERISFPQIANTIERTLNGIPRENADSYETLKAADARARSYAEKIIYE